VGLFAGENDMELLDKTNVGRDINRHYFTKNEINEHLKRPLLHELKELMLLRNNHKAFDGEFNLIETSDNALNIKWTNNNHSAELFIDLTTMKMRTNFSS
ncbi:MAG: sucrose phosphorylase, partial [Lutibacter sp.]|nr:sucrose phosphorylase [Lutibacter sp.]